jgi:hypothetical protein
MITIELNDLALAILTIFSAGILVGILFGNVGKK